MPAKTINLKELQEKYGKSVYILYKEAVRPPWMVGKNGIGLQGALLGDGDRVMCDLCMGWYESLATHISSTHKIKSDQYKVERGLGKTTPLCSPTHSKKLRLGAYKWQGSREKRRELMKVVHVNQTYEKHSRNMLEGRKTMQYRNKFGLCPEQMALRYAILAIEDNKFPAEIEIYQKDKFLWTNIDKFYKNFPKFYKAIGINPHATDYKLPDNFTDRWDDKLMAIVELRKATPDENGNCTEKQVRKELGDEIINGVIEEFGSWKAASRFAGLNTT